MSNYEQQGTGYDSGAAGHELQGRQSGPPKRELTDEEFVERCRVIAQSGQTVTSEAMGRLVKIIDTLTPTPTEEITIEASRHWLKQGLLETPDIAWRLLTILDRMAGKEPMPRPPLSKEPIRMGGSDVSQTG